VNRATLHGAALAALVAALSAGLFFACFERRTREIDAGLSPEARRNPYLAFTRLLARYGHEVEAIDGLGRLTALPPVDGVLVLPIERHGLGPARAQAILDWVAAGGHLVAVTYSLADDPRRRPDPLLDPLGFRQYAGDPAELPFYADDEPDSSAPPAPAEPAPESEAPAPDGDPAGNPPWLPVTPRWAVTEAEVRVPGHDAVLRVEFDARFRWADAQARATWAVASEYGVHLLHTAHGRGRVTALTDELFLRSDRIDRLDHAEFALRLVRMGDRHGPVWIVHSQAWPGLLARLRHDGWPALVAAVALLLAWLWRTVPRFGPLRPDPPAERRRWIEHLDAVGHFHWRDDGARTLLAAVREAVARRIASRHPAWARLPLPERAARVATAAGLAPGAVLRALEADPAELDEAGFVAVVADLEAIRRTS
jgi:hypothetical protein